MGVIYQVPPLARGNSIHSETYSVGFGHHLAARLLGENANVSAYYIVRTYKFTFFPAAAASFTHHSGGDPTFSALRKLLAASGGRGTNPVDLDTFPDRRE